MSDKADFEKFCRQHGDISRDKAMRLAYDWQIQCQLIYQALEHVQQSHIALLAVNDLCCDVIGSLGGTLMLTPQRLQSYIENRQREFGEGTKIAAEGIRLQAELHLKKVFPPGRPKGAVGPIRKAIAKLLKANHAMKNAQLWDALKVQPPRGWAFCENRAGKYVEGPKAADNMAYARFCNVCAEERKNLTT